MSTSTGSFQGMEGRSILRRILMIVCFSHLVVSIRINIRVADSSELIALPYGGAYVAAWYVEKTLELR
jgi:hypothetical protein